MKLNVLGVKRVKGKAKSGSDFDMCRLFAMVPIDPVHSEKIDITGSGFELAEMELDPAALLSFSSLTFPVEIELQTDTRPYRGKLESVVTGFLPVKVQAARASNG